jgi:hypothetical protein
MDDDVKRSALIAIVAVLSGLWAPFKALALQPPPDGFVYTFVLNGPIWYSSAPEACAAAKLFRESYWNASIGYGIRYMNGLGNPSPIWYNGQGAPGQCNLQRFFLRDGLNAGQQDVSLVRQTPTCDSYPANKYAGCGKAVDDLSKVVKSATDPTRVFHATQQCIALKACNARCTMENCDWLNKVLPDFVNPYLQKSGKWRAVESECASRASGWWGDRLCALDMAENHINNDLVPALVRSGCGSTSDWTRVFDVIET